MFRFISNNSLFFGCLLFFISILIGCIIGDLIQAFYKEYSFKLAFIDQIYQNPFDACRVLISHTYKDNNYGGLTNFLAMWGFYFFEGWFHMFLGFVLIFYPLNKFIFNSKLDPEINLSPKFLFIFFGLTILFITPIYEFLIYSYYSFNYENYNCEYLIKSIESTW